MSNLASFIVNHVKINREDLDVILSSFERMTIAKDQIIKKEGQPVTHYYFIDTGGLIMYVLKGEIQQTRYFAFENEFIGDIVKLKNKERSETYIRALEDTILYTISFDSMEELYEKFPLWQKFGRLLWETAFASVLEGVQRFQSKTAKERYLELLQRSDVINRIPLKELSPFLGITPSSLSRIRKELAKT